MLTLHGHVGFGLPSNSAVKVITQATCVGACARLEQGAVCAGVCVCDHGYRHPQRGIMHGELVNYAHVQSTPLSVCSPQLCVFISSVAHSDECLMLTHFRVSMVTGGHWPRVASQRQTRAHSSSHSAAWPVWHSCPLSPPDFIQFP